MRIKALRPMGFAVALFMMFGSFYIYTKYIEEPPTKPIEIVQPQVVEKPKSFVEIYRKDLEEDIKKYTNLSSRLQKVIIDEILATAERHNINPLIVYSVPHVESSMRPYLTHETVSVIIDGKKTITAAIGLTGIIWEFWKPQLVAAGIETKSDLYDPVVNIRAFGIIYAELRDRPLHKLAKTKSESSLLYYFGGSFKEYFERIDKKIGSLVALKLYELP